MSISGDLLREDLLGDQLIGYHSQQSLLNAPQKDEDGYQSK